MKTSNTKNRILCALFVALIAVGAFLKIPVPVVPFTLQFLFTMLAGLLLGARWGAAAVGIYILVGLIGFPVFAQGGGLGYVFQPSFGYILGFAAGAYVTGIVAHRSRRPGYGRLLAANFAGLGVVYLFGLVYYYFISHLYLHHPIAVGTLLLYGFLLAVPGDIVLCIVGAVLGKRLIPLIREGKV